MPQESQARRVRLNGGQRRGARVVRAIGLALTACVGMLAIQARAPSAAGSFGPPAMTQIPALTPPGGVTVDHGEVVLMPAGSAVPAVDSHEVIAHGRQVDNA